MYIYKSNIEKINKKYAKYHKIYNLTIQLYMTQAKNTRQFPYQKITVRLTQTDKETKDIRQKTISKFKNNQHYQ